MRRSERLKPRRHLPLRSLPAGIAIANMSRALSITASLSPDVRQDIGIQVLTRSQPISHLAESHQVSRKFVYQQGDKAQRSLKPLHRPPVMPATPCHGDVFHIQQQFEQVANGLARQAQGATTHRIKLEQTIAKALLTNSMTQKLTIQQVKAKRRETGLVAHAQDVKILCQWFSHDVLARAGPDLAVRQELFDFIEIELKQRAGKQYPSIRKLRKALHNQRDQLVLQGHEGRESGT